MDPITMWLLFGTAAAKFGGDMLGANAQKQANQLSAGQFEEQRGDTMAQAIAQFLQSQQQQRNTQSMQGLASTQMDPYAQAKALNSANIKAQFAQGYQPGQGFTGTFSTPALSDENLAAARSQFNKFASAAQPNVPVSGDPTTEDFRKDYLSQSDVLNQQIMAFLRNIGSYQPLKPGVSMNKSTLFPAGYGTTPMGIPSQRGPRGDRDFS